MSDEATSPGGWTEADRDQVYTALCRAVSAAGAANEPLYLARLSLLLIEQLKSRDAAMRAIADAKLD
jgi:hypothetical protein